MVLFRAQRFASLQNAAQKLDQEAKSHLAVAFQNQMDEKDEQFKVMKTQIQVLKTMAADGGGAAVRVLERLAPPHEC